MNWSQIYRETYPELVRFLHRKVWDEERAKDLAQETFTRALRDEPNDPRAWLFTVAANLARDEARSDIRRRRHLTLLKVEHAGRTSASDPERETIERDRRRRVRAALETLVERDRELLLLWDAGLDYREISRQTGLAVGAVGTSLARARKRLVEAFESMEKDTDHATHN